MDDSTRQSFDKLDSSSGSAHPASYDYPYHNSSAYHAYLYSTPDSPPSTRTAFPTKHSQHDSMSSNDTTSSEARPSSPSSVYSTSRSPASGPLTALPESRGAAGTENIGTSYDSVFGGARPLQDVVAEQKKQRRGIKKAVMGTRTAEGKNQGGLLGWLKKI